MDEKPSNQEVRKLLAEYSIVFGALRNREILRSNNNPTGDYAEYVVAKSLGLELAPKSQRGFDATDRNKVRYQIKGRRTTKDNPSTQLGVIRNLEDGDDFDFLIAVLFKEDWSVYRSVKIPYEVVLRMAKEGRIEHRARINGHVMHLRDSLLEIPGVENITDNLTAQGF